MFRNNPTTGFENVSASRDIRSLRSDPSSKIGQRVDGHVSVIRQRDIFNHDDSRTPARNRRPSHNSSGISEKIFGRFNGVTGT